MTLAPRQSRLLAVGILVAAVLVVLLGFTIPVTGAYRAQLSKIDDLQFRIAKFSQLAAQQDGLERQLRQVKQQNPSMAYYVAGTTSALAAANLQRYIKQVVAQNKGELISTQILDGRDDAGNSTSLNVHLKCGMQQCFPILFGIESGRPMLFVDNLTISSRQIPARRPDQIPAVEHH